MKNRDIVKAVQKKAKNWLDSFYDEETRESVKKMLESSDSTELIDSFYKDLEFGTGGLRGIMGTGTNRMNIYTVGAATQGFANYINKMFGDGNRSVSIGYDCRHNSQFFAETAANIFSANDINVYLFKNLTSTPEVSWAIRQLGCKGGVIITASHNPKEYNGYKAYWDDGSQLVPPHDKGVIEEVKKVNVRDIKFNPVKERIKILGPEFDEQFLEKVKSLSLSPNAIRKEHDMKIVFTPLHGTTYKIVPDSLSKWGFTSIFPVPEQSIPDGNFPTVEYANPEEPAAFKMAIELARQVDAELAMACDPDGDRIGISVKDDNGEWILLNGNQSNIIFTEYIIRRKHETGQLKGGEYTIKTIVSSELIKAIAEKNNIVCYDVYTGFKWIAAKIRENDPDKFIGGGEESFGFMPGAFTRDKDGVSSASLMAEIGAWCKAQKITIYTFLKEIYAKYGFSQERMIYIVRKGVSGAREIEKMMDNFRNHTPKEINSSRVILKKDYLSLKATELISGNTTPLDFPDRSNVLQFFLEDGSKISIRPSGTEPKIKFYFEAMAGMSKPEEFEEAQKMANKTIDNIIADLKME